MTWPLAVFIVIVVAAIEGLLIGTAIYWLGEWWRGNL